MMGHRSIFPVYWRWKDDTDLYLEGAIAVWMQINLWRYSAVLLIGILSGGCAGNAEKKDLIGTYKAEYPFGSETIILKEDATFEQTIMLEKGDNCDIDSVIVNTGNWNVRYADDSTVSRLVLVHHIEIYSAGGEIGSTEPYEWSEYGIVHLPWTIYWELDPDNPIYVRKQ